MTTLRQICIDALREGGISEIGVDPDSDQFDEALRRLQSLITSIYGDELGETLRSVSFGQEGLVTSAAKSADQSGVISNAYVPSNSRLLFNLEGDTTVYLSPSPQDGARLGVIDSAGNFAANNLVINGNGRRVEDAASVTLSTDDLRREWFYRADLGNWVRITDLEAEDESPFPAEFDDFLTILLAARIYPRYGAQIQGETAEAFRRSRKAFKNRYRQSYDTPLEDALSRIKPNRLCYGFDGSNFSDGTF